MKLHPEPWFVYTYWDLSEQMEKKTFYAVVKTSALLRQLLLDSPRLIDEANRRYKSKIEFVVLDTGAWCFAQSDNGEYELGTATIGPVSNESIEEGFTVSLKASRFLKIPMIKWKDFEFSVKDIIRLAAHVQGGVHRGVPRNTREHIQLAIADKDAIFNQPTFLHCLIQVNLVVLSSLKPLAERIITDWGMNTENA